MNDKEKVLEHRHQVPEAKKTFSFVIGASDK
jgi:hypothetical protein